MHQLTLELAAVVALAAAAIVGAVGLWQGLSVWAIAFRIMISGGLVFFFTLVGATILGRSILQGIAQKQMEKKQREMDERLRQDAAQGASSPGEGALMAMMEALAEAPSEPTTAERGREAA
jgi:hypothetical protein